jgi:chromate transporter
MARASNRSFVPFGVALRVWAYIGIASFGGPAAQIPLMHRVLVEERRWISESRFFHALNFCMLLPGPEAMQLATYVGWLLHGYRGGVAAGVLFVLPGFVAILALSLAYTALGDVTVVAGLFFGLKAAVVAVVLEAIVRIGKRILRNGAMIVLAALAFLGIFVFAVPFPAIVAAAALVGFWGGRWRPAEFAIVRERHAEEGGDAAAAVARGSLPQAMLVAATSLLLWFGPLALWVALGGADDVYVDLWIFFSKAAVVTFGGAYAVLAYVAQQAVEMYGWLEPAEMLDGLGMAETTPGPLIQVVQFVGYLGAYRDPGTLEPWVAGLFGAVVTTWVTYIPCFAWIFIGAPHIERLREHIALQAALSAVTAAVLGVILNLALWFGMHVLFRTVHERDVGPVQLSIPEWTTFNPVSGVIAAAAAFALLKLRMGVIPVILAGAAAGVVYRLALGA